MIDGSIQEKDFDGCDAKVIRGLIEGESVKLYKYRLRQFAIGNIDMGEQDIWITFDKRVTDTVLGMDVLQKIIFTVNSYDKRIYFCKDSVDYKQNFELNAK